MMSSSLRPFTAIVAMLSCGALVMTPTWAAARYCRDFNPSISYLQSALPARLRGRVLKSPLSGMAGNSLAMQLARANAPDTTQFSAAAIKFAAITSFIEQFPIAVFANGDPFLASLHARPLDRSVRDAMGFGGKGSRLIEPGEGLPDYEQISLEVIDTDTTSAYADSMSKIRIDRGLIDHQASSSFLPRPMSGDMRPTP